MINDDSFQIIASKKSRNIENKELTVNAIVKDKHFIGLMVQPVK